MPTEIYPATRYVIAAETLDQAARIAADASLHLKEWVWYQGGGTPVVFQRIQVEEMVTDWSIGYHVGRDVPWSPLEVLRAVASLPNPVNATITEGVLEDQSNLEILVPTDLDQARVMLNSPNEVPPGQVRVVDISMPELSFGWLEATGPVDREPLRVGIDGSSTRLWVKGGRVIVDVQDGTLRLSVSDSASVVVLGGPGSVIEITAFKGADVAVLNNGLAEILIDKDADGHVEVIHAGP